MNRPFTVAVAFVVACSVLVPATFATGVAASEHEIDSCSVLDEPGEYEFVDDVETNETDSCIEVQADNVTIDGNGHVLAGPGADSNATGFEIHSGVRDVVIRNVEVAGWEHGLDATGLYEMEDAVVRDNEYGLYNKEGGADDLRNVTVEGNDLGIYAQMGGASGTDVTIRDNRVGIHGIDGGFYDFESARIVDNDETGADIQHSSGLNLTDSTVSGNGGHGIYFPYPGHPVNAYLENTTVADNGGDGIRAASKTHDPIRLVDVTVEGNEGLEVNAAPHEEHFEPRETTSSISADGLAVGSSATTSFEAEPIRLEPVDRESLPDREGGTAVGDGLNVSGNVSGPVDLELDVDTDDDTVDLWRHDGGDWETVEEDLAVSDGSIEATVDDPGVYAPGTEADDADGDQNESDGTGDDSDDTGDDADDSGDDADDSGDDSQDESDDKDDTGDDDTENDSGPSDDDGEKDDEKSSGSNCGCPASDGDDAGEDDESSTDDTQESDDGTETEEDDESTSGDGTTGTPEDHEQQADDTGTTDGDDGSQGDGPGFGALAALVALLASVLVIRRRE